MFVVKLVFVSCFPPTDRSILVRHIVDFLKAFSHREAVDIGPKSQEFLEISGIFRISGISGILGIKKKRISEKFLHFLWEKAKKSTICLS
jgi:hypothetical protein